MEDDKFGSAADCELVSFGEICDRRGSAMPLGCTQGLDRAFLYGQDSFAMAFRFQPGKK